MLDFVGPASKYRYFTTASWRSWIRFRSCVARHLEMSESALSTSAAMLFERDDARVLETFRRVEFDYVDAIGEVSEADFFRVITERKILDKLAHSYPSPRKRHDVPLWVYMASNLSMRFHGEHHFHAFPFLVRSRDRKSTRLISSHSQI